VRREAVALGAALAFAVALVYAPVARHEFVNFDDNVYVTDNPMVTSGLTWAGVSWAFSTNSGGHWHPLTWLSLMADVQLFGVRAAPMLLENVALHAANAALLLLLLAWLTGRLAESAFVAFVFALHPLRVESVAWVVERKDVLSTLLLLLAVLAYAVWVRAERRVAFLACAVCLALGLLVKPMLVTLPVLLLLLDYWPLRRLSRASLRARLVEKLPLFALALASSVATYVAQSGAGAVQTSIAVADRLANAAVGYGRYVAMSLWPSGLAVFYPLRPVSTLAACGCALALLAAAALAWGLRARLPWLLVGFAWFVVGLLPVAGVLQAGGQAVADRFTYVPQIGLSLAVAWTATYWAGESRARRSALGGIAGIAVLLCAAASARQLGYWRDSVTLFERALAVTSGNFLAHTNLGEALERRGREAEARRHYEAAVAIHPGYAEARNNLGAVLARGGDLKGGVAHFEAALQRSPGLLSARNNLGLALLQLGDNVRAADQYADAVRIAPGSLEARTGMAEAFARLGRWEEARQELEVATRIAPRWAEGYMRLGAVSMKVGRFPEAEAAFQSALRLEPGLPAARYQLSQALLSQGREADAAAILREDLELHPAAVESAIQLAVVLAEGRAGVRDPAAAVRWAERAVQAAGDGPQKPAALEALARVRKITGASLTAPGSAR
jgi:tetratricopeptide (TPR) repeat protein